MPDDPTDDLTDVKLARWGRWVEKIRLNQRPNSNTVAGIAVSRLSRTLAEIRRLRERVAELEGQSTPPDRSQTSIASRS